jgi:DNA mismatch repair protein MutS2
MAELHTTTTTTTTTTTPQKTFADLDWRKLLEALAARCSTPVGALEARALRLLDDREAIAGRLAEVAEARGLLDAAEAPPLSGFADIRPHADRASRHAVLAAEELVDIGRTLRAARLLASFFAERRDRAPRLARHALAASPADARQLRDLEELVLSCFDDDGTLADRASPELASLRAQVRALREKLSRTIEELMERYADVLQDRYYTIRDDRYVLPIRTDAHRRVNGIVHGHSGSEQTIFVEPREISALGNDLMIARMDVAREEQRVLAELSEEVRLRLPAVSASLEGATAVDLRVAAARLGIDLGGSVTGLSDDGATRLRGVRHPLMVLERGAVVANDIDVRPGGVLVISGPNGGGKTVALKTVGLALLMLRAGLPVAAREDSALPLVRTLLTDMGDDQSLEQSLSTFAAHMSNISRLLRQAGPHDVVLLDELAGGTDPTEGAALATEIARAFAARGAAVMCTTHYGSLKLLALQMGEFEGASFGFDRDRLAPTFRLSSGAPGVSGAFAAALRYGLPADVVDAAKRRMGDDTQRFTALMEQLEAERDRAREQSDRLVEERTALEKERRALEGERKDLARRGREQVDRELKALLTELQAARVQVREVEERIRRRRGLKVTEQDAKRDAAALDAVGRALAPGGKLAPAVEQAPTPGRPASLEELVTGARVYVPGMRGEGVVVDPPRKEGGKLKVALGRVTVTAAADEVRLLDPKPAEPKRHAPVTIDAAADPESPAMTPENTLDLRGERVDDALRETDKFIDQALRKGWGVAFFIHGHGTGALRKALWEHFEASPYVERCAFATRQQGGEGVTVIWLA